jgi:hypothetical protein
MVTRKSPDAEAVKKSPSDKEAPVGKSTGKGGDGKVLDERVSQTDQAYLGATSLSEEDVEGEHDFNASARTGVNLRRDNSEFAGMSAPRTWEQQYRENATDIDIRGGVKAKVEKPKAEEPEDEESKETK